jgi:hypothetical protein
MAAMEPQPWFRVPPLEPIHGPPFHRTPAGPINMLPLFAIFYGTDKSISQASKQVNNKKLSEHCIIVNAFIF